MDNRTFKVAGISTDPKGSTKVRFANDYVGRIKILNMRKHTDIKLLELEKPMSKKEICDFLMSHTDFQTEVAQSAILRHFDELMMNNSNEASRIRGDLNLYSDANC